MKKPTDQKKKKKDLSMGVHSSVFPETLIMIYLGIWC